MFLITLPVAAQTTGRIEGRVTDVDRAPLAGARVTASSPRLQGVGAVVTDQSGRFQINALPPGIYTVEAIFEGFNPLEISQLEVSLDRTITVEIELTRAFGDVITVFESAPLLDITQSTIGSSFTQESLAQLPTSRTAEGAMALAPGVVPGIDPPFTNKSNFSLRGASVAENRYFVDGLEITDVINGMFTTSLAFDFAQEVEVKTGSWQIDYDGALGGVINVVTKSGGNELRADLFGYFTDDSLQATSNDSIEFGQRVGFTQYDFGFDAGGKLIRDELWFFAALNPTTDTRELINRQRIAFAPLTQTLFWAGKLTWQTSASHRLVSSLFGESQDAEQFDLNAAGFLADKVEIDFRNLALTYSGTPTSSWLIEALAGHHERVEEQVPVAEISPRYRDLTGTGIWAGSQDCGDPEPLVGGVVDFAAGCVGGSGPTGARASRNQLRAAVSRMFSRHEVRAGIEYRQQSMTGHFRFPSPYLEPMIDDLGTVVEPQGVNGALFILLSEDLYLLFGGGGSNSGNSDELSVFAHDRWLIRPNLTLNLGLRFNSQHVGGDASQEVPGQQMKFDLGDMIAPRLGLVWDPSGRGRQRVFGSLSRYFESLSMYSYVVAFGDDITRSHLLLAPFDGSLPSFDNLGIHLGTWFEFGGIAIDPNIAPTHSDELVIGFDFELKTDLIMGARAIYRRTENVIEDISLAVDASQRASLLTNPGGTFAAHPETGESLLEPQHFPEPIREYRAAELTLDRRLRDSWQLHGSYVYSENRGNYAGLFFPQLGQVSHLTSEFQTSGSLEGAEGPLPNDRPHQLKLYGSYHLPLGLIVGFNGAYLSGRPVNRIGVEDVFLAPTRFVTPRGSAGRTPDVWFIDLHLQYPLQIRDRVTVSLIGDLFNVTNQQSTTRVDEIWTLAPRERTLDPAECGGPGTGFGTHCPLGNPLWGTALEFQRPRSLRLGARLSWQ